MRLTWQQAVKNGLERYSIKNSTIKIERDQFLKQELLEITAATASAGKTPSQTISRVLQELRDEGFLFYSSTGTYTLNKAVDATNEDLPDDVLENAIEKGLLEFPDVDVSTSFSVGRIRRGMSALRKKTLFNYQYCCALCDVDDPGLLVASHIARWADHATGRGLLSNTICFCTLHDKLFENGYFSMNEEMELIWKSPQPIKAINIWRHQCTVKFKFPQKTRPAPIFINEHRTHVGL